MLHATHPIWLQRVVAILILLTLAGCGNAPRVDLESPADATARDARLDAPRFLDPATLCADLREPLAATLDAEVSLSPTRFRDLVAGIEREGCVLAAKGDGTQFSDFLTVSQQIATMLAERAWSAATPLADGPTGAVLGFTHEQQVAQLTVDWQPAPGAACPLDQPISECKLTPAQQLYSIRLELASAPVSADPAVDAEALKQTVYTYVMENTAQRNFTIDAVERDGDLERVTVKAPDGDVASAYVRQTGAYWTVLSLGTGFDPEFYREHAIPERLWIAQP